MTIFFLDSKTLGHGKLEKVMESEELKRVPTLCCFSNESIILIPFLIVQCKDEPSSHLILVASKKCIDNGKWRELVDSLAHPDYEVCRMLFFLD